jgi:hypothetical protein
MFLRTAVWCIALPLQSKLKRLLDAYLYCVVPRLHSVINTLYRPKFNTHIACNALGDVSHFPRIPGFDIGVNVGAELSTLGTQVASLFGDDGTVSKARMTG